TRPRNESAHEPNRRARKAKRREALTEPRPTCAGAARPGETRVSSRTEPASAESEAGAKPQQTEPRPTLAGAARPGETRVSSRTGPASAESEAGARPNKQSRARKAKRARSLKSKVEGPAPHDDSGEAEEEHRPEPVRESHRRTVTTKRGDVRSGRLRSANAEPRGREPGRAADAAAGDRQPDGAAARV